MIPLLWRAQEQEGWVSRPAIEAIADMLGMAYIRVLEVATFYFMFQLRPVGSVAHVQVCGTTSCMICGAEDLVKVCRERISPRAHELSADGKFSWEEVECLGACANAPMAQIGKDYYEDLTAESLGALLDVFAAGEVPRPGPQNGRFASEPLGGLTSLTGPGRDEAYNASVALALAFGDTVARITGEEPAAVGPSRPRKSRPGPNRRTGPPSPSRCRRPWRRRRRMGCSRSALEAPRGAGPDDLTRIKGVGPKLAALLNSLGYFHFDQIAAWTPEEVAWVDENLEGFKGRVSREHWVDQAKALAAESAAPPDTDNEK